MVDETKSYRDPSQPATNGVVVVPSDSIDFLTPMRGIYVGVGGDINVVMLSGEVLLFENVPGGVILPTHCVRVNLTNTTATNMLGLF